MDISSLPRHACTERWQKFSPLNESMVHSWVGKSPWRRERLPTPVFWPGEFHGRSSPWADKESDTTEWLALSLSQSTELIIIHSLPLESVILYLNSEIIPGNFLNIFSAKSLLPFSSIQSLSRVWLFATPWIAAPGLPVHHHLPEFTQTHIHRVRDAIQPSHPQSSPYPPAPNPSQHQSLFQWVNSSHEVAKVLELQL